MTGFLALGESPGQGGYDRIENRAEIDQSRPVRPLNQRQECSQAARRLRIGAAASLSRLQR